MAMEIRPTARPWGVCELPWDDTRMNIYAPPGDPHGARLVASTDTNWLADDEDHDGVDQANADLIVRAVNAHDAAVALAEAASVYDTHESVIRSTPEDLQHLRDTLAAFREALRR